MRREQITYYYVLFMLKNLNLHIITPIGRGIAQCYGNNATGRW